MINELSSRNCVDCEMRCEIFNVLTDDQLNIVNNSRTVTKYKAGEIIFKQGAPTSHVIFLTSGIVKVYVEGYDNKELILSISKSTQFIVGPGLYFDSKYHYSASALTDTSTCFVDGQVFKKLISQNAKFLDGFIKEFSKKSVSTMNQLVNLTQKKMHGRIAEGLLYLSENVFNSTSFDMLLSRSEIGDLTAMTKESAVRILKEFKDEKIINLKDNHLEILNMDRLKSICRCG